MINKLYLFCKRELLPSSTAVKRSLVTLAFVLLGSIILLPITTRLPVVGWDWYRFFTAHHPTDNVFNPANPYFPYTKYVMMLFMWMDWRTSLAIISGITLLAVAVGAWRAGGRYGSILLAILAPQVYFTMWIGHPDGLALLGMLTGLIPIALIKPQFTIWSFLRNKAGIFWTGAFLAAVLLIWPGWLTRVNGPYLDYAANYGWHALGWPAPVLGLIFLIGAGSDPWRLMAAGGLLSPYLLPHHSVVLLPVIGRVKGYQKLLAFFSAWLVIFGTGFGGPFRYLNLVFPIVSYLLSHNLTDYIQNVKVLASMVIQPVVLVSKSFPQDLRYDV